MSPFHSGETQVQARRGVREDADRVGGMIQAEIPPAARAFLAAQRLAVAATLDEAGRPWASLLEGPPGFLDAGEPDLLRIAALPAPGDPLHDNLGHRPELGLLVLDPATRRRMRLNGRGLLRDGTLYLLPEEVYGNCPKYIQRRWIQGERPASVEAGPMGPSPSLADDQQALVSAADTFFIASYHPERGADASHRGGRPGFVKVRDAHTLEFPDYPGNNMFNTLGNLAGYPRAGLLFVDFEGGDVLQVTGRAEVFDGPRPGVRIAVEAVRATRHGSRWRWSLVEPWPGNP